MLSLPKSEYSRSLPTLLGENRDKCHCPPKAVIPTQTTREAHEELLHAEWLTPMGGNIHGGAPKIGLPPHSGF